MPTLSKDLELVEERPFGEPLALLGRNLDVARRQEEDPVCDGLYLAVQGIGQADTEVDHPTTQFPVGVLEVQDHGLLALEAISQGLGVVEARGVHDAHPSGRRYPLVGDGPKVRRPSASAAAVGAVPAATWGF